VGTMTEQFQRLGILATWDKPYLTMNFKYQAAIARAFGLFVEQGLVYKGKKPVHWCIHCKTALAEAEVEYEDHSSPSIYVEFPLPDERASELVASICEALEGDQYLTGTGALAYLQPEDFKRIDCEVLVQRWRPFSYPQSHGDFTPDLSTLDLLLNDPDNASSLIAGAGSWEALESV